VFAPTGHVLETHPVPANRPTNCCFGGPELTTLFVTTTDGHFFKAQTDRVGYSNFEITDSRFQIESEILRFWNLKFVIWNSVIASRSPIPHRRQKLLQRRKL